MGSFQWADSAGWPHLLRVCLAPSQDWMGYGGYILLDIVIKFFVWWSEYGDPFFV